MRDFIIEEVDLDVLMSNGYSLRILLKKNSIENGFCKFVSIDNSVDLVLEIDTECTTAHLIKKDPLIVDRDCDIELRFMDAIFEKKLRLHEENESGFDNSDENEVSVSHINPYDPKLIRVDPKNYPVKMIDDMINCGEIDIAPAFQRHFVWNDITRKSRLIESLLLRIPIPVFYFSQDEQGLFQVVDGVQRLTVLNSFMKNEFRLKNLEYLHECEGKWFRKGNAIEDSLDSVYTRRIEQTQLIVNVIDPQTPTQVKYDIFRRINTGGKELNNQEIRNCLAKSKTRELLRDLAASEQFKRATKSSISRTRMSDEELVLRFVAFYLIDKRKSTVKEYKGGMDNLLDITIDILNSIAISDIVAIRTAFFNAMENAYELFGDKAFRKAHYINKSLFLGLSRVLCSYKKEEFLKKNVDSISMKINEAIKENGALWGALSMGTNDAKNISYVYDYIRKIVEN